MKKLNLVRRRALGALMTGGVVLGGATAWRLNGQVAVNGSDGQAIQQLVYQSQLAETQLCLPPPRYRSVVQAVPADAVAQMKAAIVTRVGQLYTGDQAVAESAVLQRNCAAAETGGQEIDVAGGIDSITCSWITAAVNTASAHCQVMKWTKFLTVGPRGPVTGEPRRLVNVSDSLTRTSGGWKIDSEVLSFPPGSGP